MKENDVVEDDPPPEPAAGADVLNRLRSTELARCRLAFEQYELAADLLRQRVLERIAAGIPQDRWQQGVAAEIGAVLHLSPNTAGRLLGRAVELERNMPYARARLCAGELSPEAIPVLLAGLSHLDVTRRQQADAALCADPAVLAGLGLRRLGDKVEQVAYELDAHATVQRKAATEKDRTVTCRPAPDGMARLSLLLPMAQAVGAYAALCKHAETLLGRGDEARNRGQIMADTAFERLTGRSAAAGQPVTVHLTVPAAVLLGGRPGTAHVSAGAGGFGGVLPAEIARNLVGRAAASSVAWVKRLFVAPESGAVVAMDSRQRLFPDGLAELIRVRDRYCRTPYCDAPIAHIDHVVPHAAGGATDHANAQGCARRATTPRRRPAGAASPWRIRRDGTPSKPEPPRDMSTGPRRRTRRRDQPASPMAGPRMSSASTMR